jgi:hypothetical protein
MERVTMSGCIGRFERQAIISFPLRGKNWIVDISKVDTRMRGVPTA